MATIIMDPKKIIFETDMDIVKYVSGGIITPSRQNFEDLMDALHDGPGVVSFDGDDEMEIVPKDQSSNITIEFDAIPDAELLEKYMKEVYKNRRKNNLVHLAMGSVAAIIAFNIGSTVGHYTTEKELKRNNPYYRPRK